MSTQTPDNTSAVAGTANLSFLDKTPEQIQEEVRDLAYRNLNLTSYREALKKEKRKPQGVLPGIVEAMAHLASWLYSTFIFPLKKQISLDSASGTFLDSWGEVLGIARKPGAKARGVIRVRFTKDVKVSKGTAITVNDLGLIYHSVENETLEFKQSDPSQTELEQSILIEAENPGTEYNNPSVNSQVGINPVLPGISKVFFEPEFIKNAKDAGQTGTKPESDESYRKRIKAQWLRAAAGSVPMLYEAEAQSVNGVEEARVFRFTAGGQNPKDAQNPAGGSAQANAPTANQGGGKSKQEIQYGLFTIVLRAPNNSQPSNLVMKNVKTRFDEVGLIAHQHYIQPVRLKPLSEVKLKYTSSSAFNETQAKNRIINYLASLKIGQRYTMQDLYNLFDDMEDIQFIAPVTSDISLDKDQIYTINEAHISVQDISRTSTAKP